MTRLADPDTPVIRRHLAALQARGQTPRTVNARRKVLASLYRRLGVPLVTATPDQLAAWAQEISHLQPATVASYVCHANEFYSWCVEAGVMRRNPAAGLARPKRPRRLPRPIAEDDLMAALADAPPRIRVWLVLGAWCGLRAQEIAYLRREDVMDRATRPCILVSAEAAKGGRERAVPLPPFALAELRPWLADCASGYLFPRLDGKPGPNRPNRVSSACSDWLHEHGIRASLHRGRHRFATLILQQTHDLRLVQDLLGHASPETTAIYTALDQAFASAAVAELPVPVPV